MSELTSSSAGLAPPCRIRDGERDHHGDEQPGHDVQPSMMRQHRVSYVLDEARMAPTQRVLVNACVILWMVLPFGSVCARSATARRVRPFPSTGAVVGLATHSTPAFLPSARASAEPYSHRTVSTSSTRPATHLVALKREGSVG